MDAANDNAFGSLGVGGGVGGGANVGGAVAGGVAGSAIGERSGSTPVGANVIGGVQMGGANVAGGAQVGGVPGGVNMAGGVGMTGAAMPQQQAYAAGQGDIILGGDNEQRGGDKRKWLMITGGALVAVAVIVGVVAVVMGAQSGGGGGAKAQTELQKAFNQYANYAISGTESKSELVGAWDKYTDYAVEEALQGLDAEYFTRLGYDWGVYKAEFDNSEIALMSDELTGLVDYQSELTEFIIALARTGELAEDEIETLYNNNDKAAVYSRIDSKYASLKNVEYEPGAQYAEAVVAWAKAYVDLLEQYDAGGCLVNGMIQSECTGNASEVAEKYSDYAEAEDAVQEGVVFEALDTLTKNCWAIAEEMRDVGV